MPPPPANRKFEYQAQPKRILAEFRKTSPQSRRGPSVEAWRPGEAPRHEIVVFQEKPHPEKRVETRET
jgi:hypothetical protein